MLPKDHRAYVFFTAADVKYLGSKICKVAPLLDRRLLLLTAQNWKSAAIAEEKFR